MQNVWLGIVKDKVTVRAQFIRYDCFYHIYELLILLQPDFIGWYIFISRSILCKNKIIVFKVKVTVKVQNFIESLCVLYPLYH